MERSNAQRLINTLAINDAPSPPPITLEMRQDQLNRLIESMDDVIDKYTELDAAIHHANISASNIKCRCINASKSKPEEMPIYDGT